MGGFTWDLGRHNHIDLYWLIYLADKIGMDEFQSKYSNVCKYSLDNKYSNKWNNLILLF